MARVNIADVFSMRVLDANGDPISGGKVLVQEAGTTTDLTLHDAISGGSTIANPVIADSSGRVDNAYFEADQIKIVVKDASDNILATYDHLDGSGAADTTNFVTIAGSQTITGVKTFSSTIQGNAATASALNSVPLGSAGITDATGLAGTADIAAETAGELIDANNVREAMLAAQNIVQVHHAGAESYTAATDTHLDDLDVTITPSATTSRVRLAASISLEVNIGAPGAVIYMKRGTTEIGSAATAGNRVVGHVSVPFDSDNASTLAAVSIEYIDSPATTSATTYSFHVRMNSSAVVTLNRTINDTDTNIHERATSTAIAEEIGAA
jgi:hypothetical protein